MVNIRVDRLDLFLLAYCCNKFRIFIIIVLLLFFMLTFLGFFCLISISISISILLLSCKSLYVFEMAIFGVLILGCFSSAIFGLKLALIAFLISILGSIFILIFSIFSSFSHDSISITDSLSSSLTP